MPSRNIAVQRQDYEALRKESRPGESFTRMFERLLNERRCRGELAGAWGVARGARDRALLAQLRGGRR